MKRKLLFLSVLAGMLAFTACEKEATNEVVKIEDEMLELTDPMNGKIIPGQYIVVLNDDATSFKSSSDVSYSERVNEVKTFAESMLRTKSSSDFEVLNAYAQVLKGFSVKMSEADMEVLKKDGRVKYIEPDAIVSAFLTTQESATWGLDRVDQRNLPMDGNYTYEVTGSGVNAYIIDTGIHYDHDDFGGRASFGFDAFGENGQDGNGHGTHVAGTVGGSVYGVAKQVNLIAVRVLDNSGGGTTSGVIAGMDWVAANAVFPAVANMSLGGGASTAIDDAVTNMFDAGVPVIVAAGNGNRGGREDNACKYSPAGAPYAYTVGATTTSDAKTSWSNYGDCVDIFAPGANITSAWYTSNTATNTISGTSMASPHVAGAAALFLQNSPNATAQQVYDFLTTNSTKNIVTSSSTANNHLLYTLTGDDGGDEDPPLDENQAPVADFSFTTDELTASFDAGDSYDPDTDGNIESYAWEFGDGSTGSGETTSHTYNADGTYDVTLTVTDNEGATGTKTQSVTVSETPSSGDDFTLSVEGYKVRGRKYADLTWSGASTTSVDVYRDGILIATVDNTGNWTHSTNEPGGGSHTYQLFEVGGDSSSNSVTVNY